jgi:hypothetical protein
MNIRILYAVMAVVFLAGCAKKEDENIMAREQAVFDAWMAANHPEATRAENGMYFEWLNHVEQTILPSPVKGDWVWVDYLVRDLEGNVMGHRNEELAKEEWTYTYVTHYVPDFTELDPTRNYLTQGEYAILPEMHLGESVRLYLPSTLAYRDATVSFANGYEGWEYSALNPQNQTATGVPRGGVAVTVDLTLKEIVPNPVTWELQEVEKYALDNSMMPVSDKVHGGVYYKTLKSSGGEVVPEDETVWIGWVCRFLDGKLVATNRPEIAAAEWNDTYNKYLSLDPYTATGGSTIAGSALDEAVIGQNVRYGSTVKLVYTSYFGYGAFGADSAGGAVNKIPRPAVAPYTPLTLEVTVMPKGWKPGDVVSY